MSIVLLAHNRLCSSEFWVATSLFSNHPEIICTMVFWYQAGGLPKRRKTMEMSQTAARLLGLLSLLMVPRTWSGRELADRLGVSPRTVRNDIGALRDIGYTIDGTRGNEGGYRLSPYGSAVPPLLFDSDEAVAVAVGLRSGLSCIIGGMEETSARALAKLENILPSALRARLHNLAHFTVPVAGNQPMPIV